MVTNPYRNKIMYGNQVWIDLTNDDVTRADVMAGKYFHLPSGERTTGTYVPPVVPTPPESAMLQTGDTFGSNGTYPAIYFSAYGCSSLMPYTEGALDIGSIFDDWLSYALLFCEPNPVSGLSEHKVGIGDFCVVDSASIDPAYGELGGACFFWDDGVNVVPLYVAYTDIVWNNVTYKVGWQCKSFTIPTNFTVDMTQDSEAGFKSDMMDYILAKQAVAFGDWGGIDEYSFLGAHPTIIDNGETFYTASYTLDQTGFNTWTPTTTATTIVASSNVDTFVANMSWYEYWLKWDFDYVASYKTSPVLVKQPIRQVQTLWQCINRRPSTASLAAACRDHTPYPTANNYNFSTTSYSSSAYLMYYNSSGSVTCASTASYGFYIEAVAPGFSSTSSVSPTITRKAPTIRTRCSTTYFDVGSAPSVDPETSTVKVRGTMYRVDFNTSSVRRYLMDAVDILNNPL